MSTENPQISNFQGLDELQRIFEGVALEVDDDGQKFVLNGEQDRFDCERPSVSLLGLAVTLPFKKTDLVEATVIADIDPADINLMVVAEGAFLKQRTILAQSSIADAIGETEILKRGASSTRPRALDDERHGFDVEVALVLNKVLDAKPGRPYRAGTRLASQMFRVRPRPDTGGISLVELRPDVIEEHNLPKNAQVFVEFDEDLLQAESVAESITVYANSDLLEALRLRRTGPEFDFVARNLAVVALQQLVFTLSSELEDEEVPSDVESPVLTFLHDKLVEAHSARFGNTDQEELVSMLKSEPLVLASVLTGIKGYGRTAREILRPSEKES